MIHLTPREGGFCLEYTFLCVDYFKEYENSFTTKGESIVNCKVVICYCVHRFES